MYRPLIVCRAELWLPTGAYPDSPAAQHRGVQMPAAPVAPAEPWWQTTPFSREPWWQPAVTQALHGAPMVLRHPAPAEMPSGILAHLSERERAVLTLLARGLSNREIAAYLVIATSTVKWYVKQIYAKLDVHSRTQAVAHFLHGV